MGRGFHLTSANGGVLFDILGDGVPVKIAWTASDSGNALLALDRNYDGKIESGKELFGNMTEQSESNEPNGFLALAEFDKPEKGGKAMESSTNGMRYFPSYYSGLTRATTDSRNKGELHTLTGMGVFSISLGYHDRHFLDQYGN